MKKLALILLVCVLATALIACGETPAPDPIPDPQPDHTHAFGAWEVTKEATCKEAGEKTCTCSCGETQREPLPKTSEHTFGAWVETKAPTTEEKGEEKRTCSVCGEEESREIPKVDPDHTHAFGAWEVTKEATCKEAGEKTRTCSCGETQREPLPKTGEHTFGAWVETKAPTTEEKGEEKRTCSVCGTSETREVAKLEPTPDPDPQPEMVTITFVSNGGSRVESIQVEKGSTAKAPSRPKKDGYSFAGWCTSSALTTAFDWDDPIMGDMTLYAAWKEAVDIVGYLKQLLSNFNRSPKSYLPDSMLIEKNAVDKDDIISDFSTPVQLSGMSTHGFGEQWGMVLDNINQSQIFYNVLGSIETVTTTSIAVFEKWFDENPDTTAQHTFESGIYNVTIVFDGTHIYYVLDFTTTLPVVGEQTAQIAMQMNILNGVKEVRVQLGDANALRYVVSDDSYEFAIKYLGVRRASFSITEKADGSVEGHIYEFIDAQLTEIGSSADFYIKNGYLTAVGNKADGIIGFTNVICEVYDVRTGTLLGYEVSETLSAATFDTLWFDLFSFSGFEKIKAVYDEEEKKTFFYVNGSTKAWEAQKVGGFNPLTMFSRRFDIELRTRYYYYFDAETESYVCEKVQIPMLFVQEDFYDSLAKDVKSTNGITITSLVGSTTLNKIKSDYGAYVEVFLEGKDKMNSDVIIAWIGERIKFS